MLRMPDGLMWPSSCRSADGRAERTFLRMEFDVLTEDGVGDI
jgi:hypothetical protein